MKVATFLKLATESFISRVGVEKGLLYPLFKGKRQGKLIYD